MGKTEDPHWTHSRERGAIFWLKFLKVSYRLLGRGIVSLFMYPTVAYFFLVGRSQRKSIRQYFQHFASSPEGLKVLGHPPRRRDEFRAMLEFAWASVDRFASWMGDHTQWNVQWNRQDLILGRAKKGQGGIILGAHLGNLEAMRAISSTHPALKINALMFIEHAEKYNRILSETAPEAFSKVILTNEIGPDTAIELQKRINQGEYIAILADRVSENVHQRSVRVPFMGEEALFPQGPFILASLMDAPVFTMFCFRRSFKHYEAYIDTFADRIQLERHRRAEDIENVVKRYARVLETYCREAPHQWYNFYEFWSQTSQESRPSNRLQSPPLKP